jgi:hypothetical protein
LLRPDAPGWGKASVIEGQALNRSLELNALVNANSFASTSRLGFSWLDFSFYFHRCGESHIGRDHRGFRWTLCGLGSFDHPNMIDPRRGFAYAIPRGD